MKCACHVFTEHRRETCPAEEPSNLTKMHNQSLSGRLREACVRSTNTTRATAFALIYEPQQPATGRRPWCTRRGHGRKVYRAQPGRFAASCPPLCSLPQPDSHGRHVPLTWSLPSYVPDQFCNPLRSARLPLLFNCPALSPPLLRPRGIALNRTWRPRWGTASQAAM